MTSLSLQHSLYTICTLVLLVCVWAVPLTSSAFFSTDAMAEDNTLSIGTVALDVSEVTLAASITSTVTDTVNVQLTNSGSIASQYQLSASPQACGTNFYNNLEILVEDTGVLYDGLAPDVQATSSSYGTLSLTVGAASALQAANSETCIIELSITSWQTHFTVPQLGFSDTETIVLTVTASQAIGAQPTANVVLNEIYPAVLNSATTTPPLDREWIELYNGTTNPIDVAGWDVSEFVGGDILATERRHTIVPDCTGFAASTHMEPFGTTNTIIAPGDFLVVQFCGTASYLSDSGDTVRLYNAIGAFVDDHTFGATANGKSHARIPDGGTWVDPVPTPGGVNVATRADLEAEGWTEAEILAVLGTSSTSTITATSSSTSSAGAGATANFTFATAVPVAPAPTSSTTATTTSASSTTATTTASTSATQSSASSSCIATDTCLGTTTATSGQTDGAAATQPPVSSTDGAAPPPVAPTPLSPAPPAASTGPDTPDPAKPQSDDDVSPPEDPDPATPSDSAAKDPAPSPADDTSTPDELDPPVNQDTV